MAAPPRISYGIRRFRVEAKDEVAFAVGRVGATSVPILHEDIETCSGREEHGQNALMARGLPLEVVQSAHP